MSTGFRARRERAKGTSLKSKGQGLQTEGGRPARRLSLGSAFRNEDKASEDLEKTEWDKIDRKKKRELADRARQSGA